MAVGEQLSRLAVNRKGSRAALVAEVVAREAIEALVWEDVEKAQIDDVDGVIIAEMGQTFLVVTLALGGSADDDVQIYRYMNSRSRRRHCSLPGDQRQRQRGEGGKQQRPLRTRC